MTMIKKRKKGPPTVKKTLIYALLIAISFLFMFPFLWEVSTAFKPLTQNIFTFPPEYIPRPPVWDNFVKAWTDIQFPRYMLNSFLLIIIMVPPHLFLTALTAYPLARMKFPGRTFVFYAIVGTMFLPTEGKLVPLYLIVNKLGLVNTWWAIILPGLVGAFSIFIMRQAYLNIPKEMEEAATIDGCGPFRLWWSIILPLVRPALAALGVFSFISVWDDFMWPLIVLNNPNWYPISLGLAYLKGTLGNDVRTMAAGTVVAMLPVVIFYIIMQRHFVEGLQGAVKQ